jgi:hypothetical protein
MSPLAPLLAAAEGAADEPSKVAFYVAAGALVAWAVLVSAAGITRAQFPGSVVAQRGTMAVSALLVAATLASAVLTA